MESTAAEPITAPLARAPAALSRVTPRSTEFGPPPTQDAQTD